MTESDETQPRSGRLANRVLIVLFLAMIGLPALDGIFRLDPSPPSAENQPEASFPRLTRPISKQSIDGFGRSVRRYISNDYGFRRVLLGLSNQAENRLFGRFSTPDVIPGKDGWLIYNDNKNLVFNRRFTEAELDGWRAALQWRQDWCRAHQIPYLLVFTPRMTTVYPESLPDFAPDLGSHSRLDDLVAYLSAKSTVEMLDLRGPLRDGRGLGRLYHRTDTHWNELGAYVGYRAIMDRISRWIPVKPLPLDAFEIKPTTGLGGDLSGMIALRHVIPEEQILLIPKTPRRATSPDGTPIPYETIRVAPRRSVIGEIAGAPNLPRAVVLRDSFGSALVPLLSEHFSRVHFRWRQLIQDEEAFPVELIERERPDVIIDEFTERLIDVKPPKNPTGDQPNGS